MENEIMTEVNTGAEVSELTDPTELTEELSGEEASEVADPTKTYGQSAEDNARFAAARRQAERELKAERERFEIERSSIAENAIASLGITDPESGKAIRTKADYDKFIARQNENALRDAARKIGMPEGELNDLVNNLPLVKQAQNAARQAEEAAAKIKIDKQIEEISKIDPSIKNIGDLMEMDTFPQFDKLIKMGHSFVEAYRYANIDKEARRTADKSRQATLNSINSKNHLMSTLSGTVGIASTTVPNDVKQMYRLLNPEATEAEISAHYAKTLKK